MFDCCHHLIKYVLQTNWMIDDIYFLFPGFFYGNYAFLCGECQWAATLCNQTSYSCKFLFVSLTLSSRLHRCLLFYEAKVKDWRAYFLLLSLGFLALREASATDLGGDFYIFGQTANEQTLPQKFQVQSFVFVRIYTGLQWRRSIVFQQPV